MQDPKISKTPRKIQSKDNSSQVIPSVAYIPPNKYLPSLESIQPKSLLSLGAFNALGMIVQENPDIDKTAVHKPKRHHYIPRFTLNRFISHNLRTKGSYSTKRMTGHWKGSINRYSLLNPFNLPTREISKSYCVEDLYVNKNSENPSHELEDKLGKLEGPASNIISKLIKTLEEEENKENEMPHIYKMTRRNLNLLHKFLYVMGYRKPSVAKIYRQPDPEPPEKSCLEYPVQNSGNEWLDILRFILDTPHWEIVEHGRERRSGRAKLESKFPHIKYTEEGKYNESLDEKYMAEADGCFLAIWKAAGGEEFIISNDSFGIIEGGEASWGPIHKFYVISPQVALVICSVGLDSCYNCDPEIKIRCQNSVLRDAKHKRPGVTHAVKPPDDMSDEQRLEFESKSHTREDDTMEFEVSTLTVEETRTLNAIILETTAHNGMITYCSEEALQKTLESYKKNPNFVKQSQFETLRKMLGEKWDGSSLEFNVPSSEREQQLQLRQDQFGDSESPPHLDKETPGDTNEHHPEGPAPEKAIEKHEKIVFTVVLPKLHMKQLLVSCLPYVVIIVTCFVSIVEALPGTYMDPSRFGFT